MPSLAPIALFVYNRLKSLKMTVSYLQKNILANQSILYIFSESPKNKEDQKKVARVREFLSTLSGFKEIHLKESPTHQGLARSLIAGITQILATHGSAIVLEDDIATSPYFLQYMNQSLRQYENHPEVFAINASLGASEEVLNKIAYPYTTYFIYRNSSHGWATWKDRWDKAQWDISPLDIADSRTVACLNRGGNDLTPMLHLHFQKGIDSWAVQWTYTISMQDGVCLSPRYPYAAHWQQEPGTHIHGESPQSARIFVDSFPLTYPPTTAIVPEIACSAALSLHKEVPYLLQTPEEQNHHPLHSYYTTPAQPPVGTSPYRVALFSAYNHGGAGLGAKRLHQGLLQHQIATHFITHHLKSPSPDVHQYPPPLCPPSPLPSFKKTTHKNSVLFTSAYGTLTPHETYLIAQQFDIINLHWVAHYLSLENIATLSQMDIPLVWTLRDYAPMTGGCHYPNACEGFLHSCRNCPQLTNHHRQYPATVLKLKQQYFSSRMVIVVLNQTMKREVSHSAVFADNRVEVIPNGIDIEQYTPANPKEARQKLNLPQDKPIVAFIAQNLTDSRKGFSELLTALQHIPPTERPHLITCGNKAPEKTLQDIPHTQLGSLSDSKTLSLFYSAADVTLFPSREESFGNIIIESLACGTPVVGFRTGGIPEVIEEGTHGYVVAQGDTHALAARTLQVLNGPDLSEQCRRRVSDHYSLTHIAKQYDQLFTELWEQSRQTTSPTAVAPSIPITFPELATRLPLPSRPSFLLQKGKNVLHLLKLLRTNPQKFWEKLKQKLPHNIKLWLDPH